MKLMVQRWYGDGGGVKGLVKDELKGWKKDELEGWSHRGMSRRVVRKQCLFVSRQHSCAVANA